MHTHATKDYICPICLGVKGIESNDTLILQQDIVYKDDLVMVFVASYFIGNNPGHLIVVPNIHCENIYDLPDDVGAHIQKIAKKMAVVMKKAYDCGGVTTLQNNEPDAGQHALHYHLHLFPRYEGDDIYFHMNSKRLAEGDERLGFVEKILISNSNCNR